MKMHITIIRQAVVNCAYLCGSEKKRGGEYWKDALTNPDPPANFNT